MTEKNIARLVGHIDRLLSKYIEERGKAATGKLISGDEIDIDKIISDGVFPPDDPTTPTRMALLSIGETLGLVGGEALMHQVHGAYEAQYGAEKANSLSARWDSAAGIWHY